MGSKMGSKMGPIFDRIGCGRGDFDGSSSSSSSSRTAEHVRIAQDCVCVCVCWQQATWLGSGLAASARLGGRGGHDNDLPIRRLIEGSGIARECLPGGHLVCCRGRCIRPSRLRARNEPSQLDKEQVRRRGVLGQGCSFGTVFEQNLLPRVRSRSRSVCVCVHVCVCACVCVRRRRQGCVCHRTPF